MQNPNEQHPVYARISMFPKPSPHSEMKAELEKTAKTIDAAMQLLAEAAVKDKHGHILDAVAELEKAEAALALEYSTVS